MAIAIKCNPCDSMRLTAPFGRDTLNGNERWHNGADYGALKAGVPGDTIYCVNDGIVRVVKNDADGYGNYIVVEHAEFCTLYAHLSKFNVSVGQKVKCTDIIGYMGYTGLVSPQGQAGTHLHFEIRDCKYKDFWIKESTEKAKYAVNPELHTLKNVVPLAELIKTIKNKCGYDENTIKFMLTHPWPQNFLDKFVKNLKA